jgi:uncharacterized membrane protein
MLLTNEAGGRPMNYQIPNTGQSSLGMAENVAGLLTYSAGIIAGIFFLTLEKESRFVKFHAMQSILFSLAYLSVALALRVVPVLGRILYMLLTPLGLIVWIVLMIKAYRHEYFELPLIGEVARTQLQNNRKL